MNHSREIRLIMAASSASVLTEPLNFLPFFVHPRSPGSGTGKAVSLSLAVSVWGDSSFPMIIDELQAAAKDKNGNRRFNVYGLGQGTGKSRGSKRLGMAPGVH